MEIEEEELEEDTTYTAMFHSVHLSRRGLNLMKPAYNPRRIDGRLS